MILKLNDVLKLKFEKAESSNWWADLVKTRLQKTEETYMKELSQLTTKEVKSWKQ